MENFTGIRPEFEFLEHGYFTQEEAQAGILKRAQLKMGYGREHPELIYKFFREILHSPNENIFWAFQPDYPYANTDNSITFVGQIEAIKVIEELLKEDLSDIELYKKLFRLAIKLVLFYKSFHEYDEKKALIRLREHSKIVRLFSLDPISTAKLDMICDRLLTVLQNPKNPHGLALFNEETGMKLDELDIASLIRNGYFNSIEGAVFYTIRELIRHATAQQDILDKIRQCQERMSIVYTKSLHSEYKF